MKAYLHSARLTPKKTNLIAGLVRGLSVTEAIAILERTPKKGAQILLGVIRSAVANAVHNDRQQAGDLFVRRLIVNQGSAYNRGVPMARGRVRPIKKFMSHVEVVLGVLSQSQASLVSAKAGAEVGNSKEKASTKPRSKAKSPPNS